MNSASRGDQALASSDFSKAVQYFTQALTEHPRSPDYYTKRSTALSRIKNADGGPNHAAALRDAEIALALAQERAKRELILAAQMRRAVAYYQMEKYADADYLFECIQQKVAPGGSKADDDKNAKIQDAMKSSGGSGSSKKGTGQELPIWRLKVSGKLRQLSEDDEKRVRTVEEYPSGVHIPTEKELKLELESLKSGNIQPQDTQVQHQTKPEDKGKSSVGPGASSSVAENQKMQDKAPAPSTAPAPEKVRHEWYQSNESVVVTFYVKGVPREKVDVDIKNDSASLTFPLPSGSEYIFALDPLFAPVDPSASKVSVMNTKIEMVLRKQTAGQKWSTLESLSTDVKPANHQTTVSSAPTVSSGPSYPSSSRHGAKDWDKLASSLTEKPKSKKSKNKDKQEGTKDDDGAESDGAESVDSEYGGDSVDAFFKKLYANADPDTRRAMMKSYVESEGTSLSTNWTDVGKGKVEPHHSSD